MKIESTNMSMASGSATQSVLMRRQKFAQGGNSEGFSFSGNFSMSKEMNFSLQTGIGAQKNRGAVSNVSKVSEEEELSPANQIRQKIIYFLLDMLFASRDKYRSHSDHTSSADGSNSIQDYFQLYSSDSFGFSYQTEVYSATQTESFFSTTGQVKTADGRTLDFNVDVYMSSSMEQYYSERYDFSPQDVNLCDPLVINLDSNLAAVEDQTVFFDLNADGSAKQIHRLSSGSGFLALDRNENGKIDDGSELFGTQSGDGFKDLAAYDEDGNGWIDENDSVYDKLQIWVQTGSGDGQLYSLKEKNVGAIFLGSGATYLPHYDSSGQITAATRKTGVFLFEDGHAGTIQHLDMAT